MITSAPSVNARTCQLVRLAMSLAHVVTTTAMLRRFTHVDDMNDLIEQGVRVHCLPDNEHDYVVELVREEVL